MVRFSKFNVSQKLENDGYMSLAAVHAFETVKMIKIATVRGSRISRFLTFFFTSDKFQLDMGLSNVMVD